jgi:branched-chain amino acid transport system substrate-binding protein
MKRHFPVILTMGLFFLSMLGAPWIAQAAGSQTIRIGGIYPVTGPLALTGVQFVQALKVVQDLINKRYDIDSPGNIFRSEGLPNLNGARIRVIFADSEGQPSVGQSETERLIIQEKVVALIGCYQSGVTDPVSRVAVTHGIPFLDDSATAPKLTERGFKWFFRTTPTDVVHVEGMLSLLKELKDTRPDLQIKRIAVVCEDTLFGQNTAEIIKERAPQFGFEIVADVAYPHEATDVEAEAIAVKKSNPDFICMASYLTDAILLHKAFKKYNVTAPILANSTGHIRYEFAKTLGSDANGVLATQLWSDTLIKTNKMAGIFTKLLGDRFGEGAAMGNLPARGYIGLLTLVDAINRAGSTEPDAIRTALIKTNISGDLLPLPWKGVQFDEKGQNNLGGVVIIQWQDQKQKVVWPRDAAEAKIMLPLPPWSQR